MVARHLDATGYVDWITLSVWILFSNNFAHSIEELRDKRLYNSISRTPLPMSRASKYLDGLDIVHADWREALAQYRGDPHAFVLLDPPYLATNCEGYRGKWWGIDQYADLLASIPKRRYIYFTSRKFDFVPLLQRLAPNSPLCHAQCYQRESSCGAVRNIEAHVL